MKHLTPQLWRFCIVGFVGFSIDASLLLGLTTVGGDPFLMRLPSAVAAIVATYVLNVLWTFRSSLPQARSSLSLNTFWKYLTMQSLSFALNYSIYSLIIFLSAVTVFNILFAVVCGTATALVFNFLGARWLLAHKPRAIEV